MAEKKKKKDITKTFSVKTLRTGFERFTGELSKNLRGVNRGTRGIKRARQNKGK
ncbi:hypothetical protein LCGC14_1514730 [marine sediment metagenome]|uniref:Uncharacterized protein n=1 Tax=marine sediment metagenome TaxID=412755 RepID=A0A0F9M1G6_9ZZZZ